MKIDKSVRSRLYRRLARPLPERVTDVFTGRYARVLRNGFSESYRRSGAPVLPFPWHYLVAGDIYRQAVAKDQQDAFPLVAGQSVGLINNLRTAAEVVESVVRESRVVMQERLPREVTLSESAWSTGCHV